MFYLMHAKINLAIKVEKQNLKKKKLFDYHALKLYDLAQTGKFLTHTALLILTDKSLPLLLLLHTFLVSWCVDSAETVGLTWPSCTESSVFRNRDLVLD